MTPWRMRREGPSWRPALFTLHGFAGEPSMWDGITRAVVTPASLFGTIVDGVLPGHGPSPWFPDGCSVEDDRLADSGAAPTPPDSRPFVATVHAFASSLPRTGPRLLVGYSMGARVALGLAMERPQSFAALVLIGTRPGIPSPDERLERARLDRERARALRRFGLAAFLEIWESLPLFATQKSLPRDVREQRQLSRRRHTVPGLAWSLEALSPGRMPDMGTRLLEGQARLPPTILVTGALDDSFTRLARELIAAAPSSLHLRHVVVPGAGHDVALEAPLRVAGLLADLAAPLLPAESISKEPPP